MIKIVENKNILKKTSEKIIDVIEIPYYRIKNWLSDVKFEQIIQVRHKNELFGKLKKLNSFYVHWDICESLATLTFAQFEMHYTKYNKRYFPIDESVEHLVEESKNKYLDADTRMFYKKHAKEVKERNLLFYNIHQYITIHRVNNQKILDNLTNEMFEDVTHEFVKCDNGPRLYEWRSYGDRHFSIKWKFDKQGQLIYSYKEVHKYNNDINDLETAMMYKDTEFAKIILDNRLELWD